MHRDLNLRPCFTIKVYLNHISDVLSNTISSKEFVLLRRAIYLEVKNEKVKFSNCVFCDNFSDYEWTYM